MTVETMPSETDDGSQTEFDTHLWAFETCDEYHSFGAANASDDDDGDGLLSKIQFTLQPNQGIYIVLSGYGRECGRTDVVFSATTTPPPMPPSPSPPPMPPPVPPSCGADRSQSPTGGLLKSCTVHNDPHINQFERDYPSGNGYLTCDIPGPFTILENEFITITGFGVSNLFEDWRGASVVENITISYRDSSCGPDAVLGYGVDDFEEWDAPLINTRVTTRRSNMFRVDQQYLRVYIRTPWTGFNGVCTTECPAGTEVDGRRRSLLQKGNITSAEAEDHCIEQGLEGPFLDSCVFDLVGTEDEKSFLETNKEAETETAQVEQEVEQDNEVFAVSQSSPPPPAPSSATSPEESSPDSPPSGEESSPPDDSPSGEEPPSPDSPLGEESPSDDSPSGEESPSSPTAPPASERSGAVTITIESRVSGYDEGNLRDNQEARQRLFDALATAVADNLAERRPALMLVNTSDGESAQDLDRTVKQQHRDPCYECIENELEESGVGNVVAISTTVLLPDDTDGETLDAFVDEIEQAGADIFEGSGEDVELESVAGDMDGAVRVLASVTSCILSVLSVFLLMA